MDFFNKVINAIKSGIDSIFSLFPGLVNWFITQWQAFWNLQFSQLSLFENLVVWGFALAGAATLWFWGGRPFYHATMEVMVALGEWFIKFIRFMPVLFLSALCVAAGIWIVQTYTF